MHPRTHAARYGFAAVALAAGASGVALLASPDSTGDFFSWELGPPPLASLIGGLYVASAVVFGAALRMQWVQVRSLVAAAVVLTGPTFVATMIHLEVFDRDRWQAWFWILLFGGAPWFWAGLLTAHRESSDAGPSGTTSPALIVVALVAAAAAVVVWVDPVAASKPLPFDFSPMGGRFAGAWLAFLAVLVGWAGARPREARFPLAAVAVYLGGAFVAGLRSISDLTPSSSRLIYLVALAAGAAVFTAAAVRATAGSAPIGGRGS